MFLGECLLIEYDIKSYSDNFHFEFFDCGFTGEEALAIKHLFGKLSLTGELSSFTWYVKMLLGMLNDPDTLQIRDFMQKTKKTFAMLKHVQERIKALNFDWVVCDNFRPWCSAFAQDLLGLPYINVANGGFLGTRYSRWGNNPSPMSYVPEYITGFTDSMTFGQRLKNVYMHVLSLCVYDVMSMWELDNIRDMWGNRSSVATHKIMGASSLYIMNWDFHLEYPRPLQSNVVMCGGMSATEAKPLSQVKLFKVTRL